MPTFGPKTLICEGYDPANSLDLVYAKRDDKVYLFSGTSESLLAREQGCQITESLADVGIVPPVSEAAADDKWVVDPKTVFIVEGVFQRWGTKNANGRTYPRELFEGILGDPKSAPMQAIAERRMTGHLEHPSDGRSNIKEYAILTTDLKLVPNKADGGKSGIVRGRSELLETPNGTILRTLTKHKIPWGVSSRGTGSVDESGNVKWSGKNEDDDFKLITFDAVDNPSTPGARNFTPAGQVKEGNMSSPAEAEKHRLAKDKLPLQSYEKIGPQAPDGSPIPASALKPTDKAGNTGAAPSGDATGKINSIPGDPQEPFSRGADRDKAYDDPKGKDESLPVVSDDALYGEPGIDESSLYGEASAAESIPGHDAWKTDDHDRYAEKPWPKDDEGDHVHPLKGIEAGHHVYVEHPDIPGGRSNGIVTHKKTSGDGVHWLTVQTHKGPIVDVDAHADDGGHYHLDDGHYVERRKRKQHEPTESAASSARILSWVTEAAERLDEKGIARLFKHMDSDAKGYAIVSAYRGDRTKRENEAHSAALEAHLRKRGHGYHHVDGAYVENPDTPHERVVREKSFFVPGVSSDEAAELAKHAHEHHQQDSVLHGHGKEGAHLMFGGSGEKMNVGDQAMAVNAKEAHKFFTLYRNHKFIMAARHRRPVESVVGELSSAAPGSVEADEAIGEVQSLIADRETANEDRAALRQALAEFAAKAVSPMLKPSPTKFPTAVPKQKTVKQKRPAVVGMGVGESSPAIRAPSRNLLSKLLASKIYHKTGWDVSRHLADSAEKAGFNREHVDSDHDFSVPYEATVTKHFHVGHKTGIRAVIYRMPSGTYELTAHHVQHDDESADESLDEAGSVGTLSRDLISLRGTSDTTIPLMILQYLGGAAFTERNQVYGYTGTVDGLEFKLAYPSGVQSPSDIPTVDCAITMDNKGTYAVRVGKRAKTRVNAENLKATFASLSGKADPSVRTPQRAKTYAPESVGGDDLDAIYEGGQVPVVSAPDLVAENRKLALMLDSAKGALVKMSQSVTEDARASSVNETGGTGMPRTVAGGRQAAGDEKSASRKMLPKTVTESAPMPAATTVAINEEAPRSVQIFRSMRAGASA